MGQVCHNDVIICDQYLNDVSKKITGVSESVEKLISDYNMILNNLVESGIAKGETNNILKEFSTQSKRLNGQLKALTDNLNGKISEYLENIEIFDLSIY